jgi:hypothetical protein
VTFTARAFDINGQNAQRCNARPLACTTRQQASKKHKSVSCPHVCSSTVAALSYLWHHCYHATVSAPGAPVASAESVLTLCRMCLMLQPLCVALVQQQHRQCNSAVSKTTAATPAAACADASPSLTRWCMRYYVTALSCVQPSRPFPCHGRYCLCWTLCFAHSHLLVHAL